MVHIDAQSEIRALAQCAGIPADISALKPGVLTLVDKVASICGVVADQGGRRSAMLHAVDKILCHEPPALRELATLLAHRCASIAEMHNPDEDDGPGDDIRSAFGDLP